MGEVETLAAKQPQGRPGAAEKPQSPPGALPDAAGTNSERPPYLRSIAFAPRSTMRLAHSAHLAH